MENIILDKNYKGLKQIDNGDYILDGDLIIDGNLIVKLDDRLVINGNNTVSGYM